MASNCKFCGNSIQWKQESSKWISYNPNSNTKHFPCDGFITTKQKEKAELHKDVTQQFYIDREKWRLENNFYNQTDPPPWDE